MSTAIGIVLAASAMILSIAIYRWTKPERCIDCGATGQRLNAYGFCVNCWYGRSRD